MMPVRSKRAKIPLPTATGGRPQPTLSATPRAGKGGIHAALPPRGPLSGKNDLEREMGRICLESMMCGVGAALPAGTAEFKDSRSRGNWKHSGAFGSRRF